jgi:hypothetical protein
METSVTQTIRLGDEAARGEIKALRKLSQEERLKLLISGMAETSGTKEQDDGMAFRRRLAARRITSRRPPARRAPLTTPAPAPTPEKDELSGD